MLSSVNVVFTCQASADIIGDQVTASLIRNPGNGSFDPTAISGTAVVVDPGVEFQGQAFSLGSARIDAFVDINDDSLLFTLAHRNDTASTFGGGGASTLTLLISDIDWSGNPFQVDLEAANGTDLSFFSGNPNDFDVTTTPTSIQIDITGGFRIRSGEEISLRYGISAVPEPSSALLLLATCGTLLARRRRNY